MLTSPFNFGIKCNMYHTDLVLCGFPRCLDTVWIENLEKQIFSMENPRVSWTEWCECPSSSSIKSHLTVGSVQSYVSCLSGHQTASLTALDLSQFTADLRQFRFPSSKCEVTVSIFSLSRFRPIFLSVAGGFMNTCLIMLHDLLFHLIISTFYHMKYTFIWSSYNQSRNQL